MNRLFIILVSCFFSVLLFAQNPTNLCLEFEELPLDTMYGTRTGYAAGDTFFEKEGVRASLKAFEYPDGSSDLFGISVLDNPFRLESDIYSRGLFISNANAHFEFSGFSEDVVRLSLNFADGGGEENFAVNGEEIKIVNLLSDLDRTIAPGVVLLFRVDSTIQGIEYGTLVLEGNIKNLTIGGQELFIDNLCINTSESETCSIRNLAIRPGRCLEQQYMASINFEHQGADNELFNIYLNGELIATKPLADLPVEFEMPYLADAEQTVLSVCINDRPNCCERILFEQPNCEIVSDCVIKEVFLEPSECDENGQFLVNVFVVSEGGSRAGFFIKDVIFEDRYGPFSYSDSIVTIGPFVDLDDVVQLFRITDVEDENCSKTAELLNVCPNNNCELVNVVFEPHPCDEDETFLLDIEVTAFNGSAAGFFVTYFGERFGPFSYEEPFVTVGPLSAGFDVPIEVGVVDALDRSCFWSEIITPPCSANCNLDIRASTSDCNEEALFFLELSVSGGGGTYTLEAGGQTFGPFNYSENIARIGPFRGNGTPDFPIVIHDNQIPACTDTLFLEAPCFREACDLRDLTARAGECRSDGSFNLFIDYDASDTPSDTIEIKYEGEFIGFFSTDELPIVIENFPFRTNRFIELCVYQNSGLCCTPVRFELPDGCGFNTCVLEDVRIEPQRCDEAGQFFVNVSVFPQEPTSDGYIIDVLGEIFGPFAYRDSLVSIGPFDGNLDIPYEIIIADKENDRCFYADVFQSPCSASCQITDLVVETSECFDNGAFNLVIDFEVQNAENDFFDVFYQDRLIGTFNVEELPITIEDFRSRVDVNARDFISICLNDNPDCCARGAFLPPCSTSDCHITDVIAEPLICENNQFNVDLFVVSEQPNSTGYFIQINDGQLFGPFSYQQEFVTIGPFDGDGRSIYRVNVIDGEDRSCTKSTRFQAVNCAGQCSINNLSFEVGEICSEDGSFPLSIDFEINNPVGFGYSVFLGDRLIGTYPYGTIPLYFPEFNIGGRASATISIIAGEDRNCAMRKTLEAPECSRNTNDLWPGDTNNDGIANHVDLLNIGLAYGAVGPIRADSSLDWYAHEAFAWDLVFRDGINYKYTDTNGDGRIDELDIAAIEMNYGLLQDDTTSPPEIDNDGIIATEGDPSIYVDLPATGDFPDASAFSLPIILGSADRSVESVYGIAFTIEYDPQVIDPEAVKVTIPDTWLGTIGEDLIMIQQAYPNRGMIDIAITRTDGESVRGYGVIALMSGIIVDLVGLQTVVVKVSKVKAITEENTAIPIFPEDRTSQVTSTKDRIASGLDFYPNPTSDLLYIKNTGGEKIEKIEILNLQGKLIQQFIRPEESLDLLDIPAGLYFLKIQTLKGFYHQQIVKE